ncbi:MAG: thiamine phosphate synthase [Chloroflexi bacterium]|nr:thiamine phosphate synthase [Chloroflexota bacterium]
MADSRTLAQSLHDSLACSIATLAEGCPSFLEDPDLIQRLAEVSSGLQVTEEPPAEAPPAALSLEQALELTDTSQHLLASLQSPWSETLSIDTLAVLGRLLRDLSAGLAAAFRSQQSHKIRGLYVIIDPEVTRGRDPLEVAAAAIRGGARMLQLRDKLRDKGESMALASSLQELCQANDALLIINDHLDLAVAVGAGGAHVGQTDLPIAEARQVLRPHQVLGRSNREFEQLAESQEMGADHVAFGPIYDTNTKSIVRQPQGIERLKLARAVATVPLVAIGGINIKNVAPVVEAGADAICVTAAVGAATNPEAAARRLVKAIQSAGGRV